MAHYLVVDDEESARNLLGTILTRLGHSVAFAATGSRAMASFEAERPDVVILDLRLSDENGITILEHIRTKDRAVPVIIWTGAGSDMEKQRARALNVTDFLQKGFSLHELNQAFTRAVKEASQPIPLAHNTRVYSGACT
jgi:DNA-binding NtrC family response regulator